VEESAVFGVPHPDFGEAVTAVVVARPGAQVETTALLASLKGAIANYKVPKQIHLLEALPRNVMGKVQKNLLRDQFSRP
jgi:malonyl-CoA/methylmalonyl-CoA synthetase